VLDLAVLVELFEGLVCALAKPENAISRQDAKINFFILIFFI